MEARIRSYYEVEGGTLNGTIMEPILSFLGVKYPHRRTKDLYVPPMVDDKKMLTTPWHCCQENCPEPEFHGGMDELLEHLMLHKGRLLRPWSKKLQLKAPIPAVRLPRNPWDDKPKGGVNEDRRFCIDLYVGDVKAVLRKQGLEIL